MCSRIWGIKRVWSTSWDYLFVTLMYIVEYIMVCQQCALAACVCIHRYLHLSAISWKLIAHLGPQAREMHNQMVKNNAKDFGLLSWPLDQRDNLSKKAEGKEGRENGRRFGRKKKRFVCVRGFVCVMCCVCVVCVLWTLCACVNLVWTYHIWAFYLNIPWCTCLSSFSAPK